MQVRSIVVAAALAAASIPLAASAQFMKDGAPGGFGHGGHGGRFGAGLFASNPTLVADRTALDTAFGQLTSDVRAGNTTAVSGDQAAITAALGKLQSDRTALVTAVKGNAAVQAAKTSLQADHLALERDRVQLRSDQIAGNTAAVDADKQALAADMTKVRTDLKALADAIAAVSI